MTFRLRKKKEVFDKVNISQGPLLLNILLGAEMTSLLKIKSKKSSICVNVKVQLVTKFYNCHSSRIINSRLQIGRNLLKFLKIFKTEFFENPYNKDKSVGLQEIQCGTVIAFNIISTSENISTQFVCTILQ